MEFDPSDHVREAGRGRTIPVFEETMRIRSEGKHSGGAFEVVEILSPPGTGPPLHTHREQEEFFYVLEGTFTVMVGESRRQVGPGVSVTLPRGVGHTYRNSGEDDGRLLVCIVPAGGVPMFEALSELTMPPDTEKVAGILDDHNVDLEGPPLDAAD